MERPRLGAKHGGEAASCIRALSPSESVSFDSALYPGGLKGRVSLVATAAGTMVTWHEVGVVLGFPNTEGSMESTRRTWIRKSLDGLEQAVESGAP